MILAVRAAAVALVATAAGSGLAASPDAAAAVCSGASGVSVVVDFSGNPDGGGVTTSCAADGAGRSASRVFPSAGYPLTYAQREPGFVCRISGAPSSDPCQVASPTDAYWGLFWSDGRDGAWHYATAGVGGIKVPQGGSLAFVWQDGGARDTPPVAPPKHAAQPTQPPSTPAQSASSTPTASPTVPTQSVAPTSPGTPLVSPSATDPAAPSPSSSSEAPLPSVSVPATAINEPAQGESSQAAAAPEGDLPSSAEPASESAEDGALPPWVLAIVFGVLGVAAAAVLVVRRRSS